MSVSKKRRNQFGEEVGPEDEYMSINKWSQRWAAGQTRFHMPHTHAMLKKHFGLLTSGRPSSRFFLPLCGKSVDLHWLAEKGNVVIGNEAVELGCRQFFEENDLDYVVSELTNIPGKVFKSAEEDIDVTLYCCDFFALTKEDIGPLDCIWDRGSFAAIDNSDRKRYASAISNLMTQDTRYLLDTFKVDNNNFAGPPYDFEEDILPGLFGSNFEISLVDKVDILGDWQRSWGVEYFTECVHLLKMKN